jgi:hypothetical protein
MAPELSLSEPSGVEVEVEVEVEVVLEVVLEVGVEVTLRFVVVPSAPLVASSKSGLSRMQAAWATSMRASQRMGGEPSTGSRDRFS